jgi:uracil-DNA glycosylase
VHPTQPDSCKGCPLYGVSRGFVLGSGSPEKAKYCIVLEAPGQQEIQFTIAPNPHRSFLRTQEECDEEIATRKRDYPDLTNGSTRNGVPVVGPTGLAFESWILRRVGIRRDECFIDNTIRCLPPKSKSGAQYPTGEAKKAAELHCRRYDRIAMFRPDTVIFGLHPAGILREITPLPLAIKDFEKVRDFTNQGRRVLALLGGKSTSAFMRYGSNVTKWRGHYSALPPDWSETYRQRFEYTKKTKRAKKVVERPAELTESCASCKRYKGRTVPKHACAACWRKYEEQHVQVPS